MIDGVQLLTLTAIGFYMFLGVIVGFIAGLILIPGYCVVHPLVLALWERHRVTMDLRKCGRMLGEVLVEKMRELDLQTTKEVLKEQMRERGH